MQVNAAGPEPGRSVTATARRAQIVAATIDTLAELGYTGTTFARIAERAGLSSTRLISYHFADKRELLAEVVRSVYAAGTHYVSPRVTAEKSAPAMLAACLRANVEFIRDHGNHVAAVNVIAANLRIAETGAAPSPGGSERDEMILVAIEAILRKGQADGDFRDFDTRTMAWVIRNALDGVQQRRALDPDLDFDACSRELVALFGRATARREPR